MSLKTKAVGGLIWTFAQQFSVQLINFGVQIILARLLMPEMFGLIAMLAVFIAIGQSLMDSGMTSSLIRTKNPNQLDYSTVFLTNVSISTLVYIIVFFIAPSIANFYEQDILKDILRVYAISFVIKSLIAVHIAKLTKEMNFKLQMKLQIPSTIIGAIVGISLALNGYGVWSLVWLNLAQSIGFALQIWFFVKWRPSLIFNLESFKYHFSFGYKMTISGLIDTIYNDSYRIVIGKFFSPSITGFFNQADMLRNFPVLQLSSVVNKVTYPLFSEITSDGQLKNAYKNTMQLLFFLVVPIMMILIVVAKEVFLFLFGTKWLPSVPYFQILALASIVRPIGSYNLNILKVKGRSDLFLKVEVIKKIIGFTAILVAIQFGIMGLVISSVIVAHLSTFINMAFSGRLIDFSLVEQLKICYIIYFIGLVCLVMSYFLRIELMNFIDSPFYLLTTISAFFVTVYLILSYTLEREVFLLINRILKK